VTPAPRPRPAVADPGRIRLADSIDRQPEAAGPAVHRLLWGWPEILAATGIPRRTLEREIAAGRFPKPVRRVGRRPFFKPSDIIRWSEGGGRP
jgi:predicted DNA-binding transcriptional regulator AlpA